MEFSLTCPNDGAIEVGLEDISSIVFNGFENVDVVFVCPECGEEIRVRAKMPNLLITTLDLSETLERTMEQAAEHGFLSIEPVDDDLEEYLDEDVEEMPAAPELSDGDKARIEHYCEYFKRQLDGVDTVEAFLLEADQR